MHLFKFAFLSLMSLLCLLRLKHIFNQQHFCLLASSTTNISRFFFWFLVSAVSHITLPAASDIFYAAAAFKNNIFRSCTWKRTSQINGGERIRTLMGRKKKWQISFLPRPPRPEGKVPHATFYSSTGQQLSGIFGCTAAQRRVFFFSLLLLLLLFFSPSDGPYSSPPLCCAQLAGLSVVTTSPFNAPDRGLFAPIYVFSPITPWQAVGCQATALRCWWSPLWLVLPASSTIFFIFLDSIREEDSLICLSLVQSVV